MSLTSHSDRPTPRGRIGILFYLFSAVLIYGIFFMGMPIGQAYLEHRRHRDVFLIMIAVLGILVTLTANKSLSGNRDDRLINRAALALPLYVLLQMIPLPLALVAVISPSRAELVRALTPVTGPHIFASLSIIPGATLIHLFLLISYCIVFFSIREFALRARDRAWVIASPIVVAAAIEAVLGLMQFFSGGDTPARGTFVVRDHFAGLLEMALPFPAMYALHELRKAPPMGYLDLPDIVRICAGAALATLILVGSLCSLSRGGLVSILAGAFAAAAFVVGRDMPLRKRIVAVSAFSLILAVGLFYITPVALVARLAQHTTEGRVTIWKQAIGIVGEYPVVGCGMGGFQSAFLKFKAGWGLLIVDYAHNDYLQFLIELGIAGFAIGVLLIGCVLVRVLRAAAEKSENRWLAVACIASFTAIAVHSLVDFNLYVACNAVVLSWICGLAASLGPSRLLAADGVIEATAFLSEPPGPNRDYVRRFSQYQPYRLYFRG